jgi:hypothetical protein
LRLLAGLLGFIALLSALLATLILLAALVLVRIGHNGTPLVISSNTRQPPGTTFCSGIGVGFFFVLRLVDLTNGASARLRRVRRIRNCGFAVFE